MQIRIRQKLIAVTSVALIAGMFIAPLSSDARGLGRGQGNGMGNNGAQQQVGLSSVIADMPIQNLDASEKDGLLKMREEEKLARDVYQVLYQKWNHLTFAQITKSEQQHMDTIKILLDKYGLVDPVTSSERGVFADQELQKLYHSLVARGEKSMVDALQVGATIEDLDIKDLYDLIEQTDNKDIKIVYQNLVKGSRNHLRAFSSRLSLNNSSYKAQFLAASQVENIINSPNERGMVDENGVQLSGRSGSGKGKGRKGGQGGGKFI